MIGAVTGPSVVKKRMCTSQDSQSQGVTKLYHMRRVSFR